MKKFDPTRYCSSANDCIEDTPNKQSSAYCSKCLLEDIISLVEEEKGNLATIEEQIRGILKMIEDGSLLIRSR